MDYFDVGRWVMRAFDGGKPPATQQPYARQIIL